MYRQNPQTKPAREQRKYIQNTKQSQMTHDPGRIKEYITFVVYRIPHCNSNFIKKKTNTSQKTVARRHLKTMATLW